MTPDELRSLVGEATPGPWTVEHDWGNYAGPEPGDPGGDWVNPHGAYSSHRPDNALIALAPELALLVADMGVHLEWYMDEVGWTPSRAALLARLAALGDPR